MAGPGMIKRHKEIKRQERRAEKEAERAQRKRQRTEKPASNNGEDPDIAGIVPGPQPLPDAFAD